MNEPRLASASYDRGPSPLRVNIFGLFDIPCGLQVAALNTATMLAQCGHEVSRVHVGRGLAGKGLTSGLKGASINIFHINPEDVYRILCRNSYADLGVSTSLNVCVPFWELPVLPAGWLPVLAAMDVVLAPTEFIKDAVSRADPSLHVAHYPQAVNLPANVVADRARFGIPEGAVAFVFSLAVQSVVERKNPGAVVHSFLRAFPKDREDVFLLLRIHSTVDDKAGQSVVEGLRRAVAGDPRIRFIQGKMSYPQVLTLYASADVYVSLHRSEGLGLGPMEAMALGKPVVATGWSGNMDFMTSKNSMPVGYRLIPVEVNPWSAYGRRRVSAEAVWAEPDLEEAAAMMRTLADDPELRGRLGARAKADIAARIAAYEGGQVVATLEDAVARLGDPKFGHANRVAKWRGLRGRAFIFWYLRRPLAKIGRTVRPGKAG